MARSRVMTRSRAVARSHAMAKSRAVAKSDVPTLEVETFLCARPHADYHYDARSSLVAHRQATQVAIQCLSTARSTPQRLQSCRGGHDLLLEKRDPSDVRSRCPTSLLSPLSKGLERVSQEEWHTPPFETVFSIQAKRERFQKGPL